MSWDDLSPFFAPHLLASVIDSVERCEPILLMAYPGVGATMIARRITDLLPELEPRERTLLESIYRSTHLSPPDSRPFRAPHHSVSTVAITGSRGRAGELDLAHHGVLYLDEMPEFRLGALESVWSADCLVVASAYPCPCGWHHSGYRQCSCPQGAIDRYRSRIPTERFGAVIELPVVDLRRARAAS